MAHVTYDPKKIRTAIRGRGLTANDISRRSRGALSPNVIRNMESGLNARVQEEKLIALARCLYVDVAELKGDE
jgi:transcriptional regulator with XRE-family HTH domain